MNTRTKNPIRIAAAVALFAAVTAGAHTGDVPQVHVKYADLNVNTTAGASVLYERIRSAADRVCGTPGAHDLARIGQAQACAARAIAEAVTAVNAPALTSVYDLKIRGASATRLATIR